MLPVIVQTQAFATLLLIIQIRPNQNIHLIVNAIMVDSGRTVRLILVIMFHVLTTAFAPQFNTSIRFLKLFIHFIASARTDILVVYVNLI